MILNLKIQAVKALLERIMSFNMRTKPCPTFYSITT